MKRGTKAKQLLLLGLLFSGVPATSLAQNISMQLKNARMGKVFQEIKSQTGFSFVYSDQLVDINKLVSVKMHDLPLDQALKQILDNTGLTADVRNGKIYLVEKSRQEDSQKARKITGTVVDESGETIVGANVMVAGDKNGTITDFDGKFALEVQPNAKLVISYIGFNSQEIKVGDKTSFNIVLKENLEALEEVVVVGYGVQKKRDLTGAVSSVKLDESPVSTVSTVSHMLAGKAAGLQVTQGSAQVGGGATFRIRGAASTGAGNSPLIILDGFPISSSSNPGSGNRYDAGSTDNVLESINPNDIESIEVLKDASSTAIYGSRAGHGVIIITTKRGKQQKVNVTYSGSASVQDLRNAYEILDAHDYMEQRNRYSYELYLKSNGLDIYKDYIQMPEGHVAPDYIPMHSDEEIASFENGTDWFREVTQTGFHHSHNVSLNGGTESTKYMASVNFYDQSGVIKNNNLTRLTSKFNLDQQITKYVKAGFSMNLSRNEYDNVPIGPGEYQAAGIISSSVRFSPLLPVKDENGNYVINPDYSQVPNPVSLLEITDKTTKDRFLGSGYLQVEPTKGLILKAVLGVDRRYTKRKNYLPKTTLYGANVNGQASINQNDATDLLMDLTANYSKTVGNHNFTALLGYSYQEFNWEGVSAGNQDFLIDSFLYNNLGAGAYAKPSVGSWAGKNSLGSYFGRFNYSYLGRYLLTATVRADGASNFVPENRWGYFPSVSVGWRFIDENFMSSWASSFMSNGKLRLSYGQTGNSNVGNRVLDYFRTGGSNVFGDVGHIGVFASQLGNPNLTWETTAEYNLGIDLGFFNNRISLTAEYFNRTISDLLVTGKPLPSYNEIKNIAANIGKTQSSGFEISLNTINIANRNFSWSTDLTLSQFNDRWKERDPNWKPAVFQSVDDPIRATFTFRSDGLLQAGEKAPAHQASLLPGQVKLKDLNGDGKLDDHDKEYVGCSDPRLIFGFNNSFTYKNFDLGVYFYGQLGMLKGASYYENWASMGRFLSEGSNVSNGFKENWTHENRDTETPSPFTSDYSWGDYNLKKVHFIRLRNLTLGYTLPVPKKLINRFRVYVDINNPFVITNWNGLDPETDGHQYAYPNVTSYSFGIDLTF